MPKIWTPLLRTITCLATSIIFHSNVHAAISPQEILAASDAVRNPSYSFGLTNTITEYREGKKTNAATLGIYSKPSSDSGQFRSLVRFLAPSRDANKLMLYSGTDLWFFDPSSKASIRLSPQQRLLGQASNGDVVTVNLAKDYLATAATVEDVMDGEKQTRHCYKVTMQKNNPDATYDHIDMWIEVETFRPVRGHFFTESGKLLKSAYYRHVELQLGAMRPTETVIIDGLDPLWVTVMRYANMEKRDVPELWLQREYLPRFKSE